MAGEQDIDETDTDPATAVGLVALGDVTLREAAEATGVARWEIHEALEKAALAGPLGVELDGDVAAEIDAILDERRSWPAGQDRNVSPSRTARTVSSNCSRSSPSPTSVRWPIFRRS